MLPQLAKLKGIVLDLLFPQWCVGCGKEGGLICPSCYWSLPRIMPPICPKCGKPQSSGTLCPGCIGRQTEMDGIRSPFRFDGVVRQAIHQLKYRNLRTLAMPLSELLKERRSNVARAFSCRDHRLQDKQVLLIDDVSTSGATLNACAIALKAAGATSVWGLVLAREI